MIGVTAGVTDGPWLPVESGAWAGICVGEGRRWSIVLDLPGIPSCLPYLPVELALNI